MILELFTTLIDTLNKVASGLKTLVNLPIDVREKYRQTIDDTYRMIDITLNMIIIRLGDILLDDENNFIQGTIELGNYGDWLRAEREFRLCKSLRALVEETETLREKLVGALSTRDWDALVDQLRTIFLTETELAGFIGEQFEAISNSAKQDPPDVVRKHIEALRNALIKQRQKLIRQEISFYGIV